MAPQTAASEVAAHDAVSAEAPLDRTVPLPSGATLKVAADWTVTASADGLILEDPEKQLTIELVEVEATAGMSAAISAAWSRRRPGFNRQELAASDSPGREGWDLFRWSRYKTSPEEARRVSAFVARKGTLAVVVLVDSPLAAVQRRSSQVGLVHDRLRPAGYVRETYRGRTPRPLDAAHVAYLKAFIDRMREAADVPGVSVVLFDKHATLIEEGFGVRERGRPEPVTADSLYISRLTRSESRACAIAMASWAAASCAMLTGAGAIPRGARRTPLSGLSGRTSARAWCTAFTTAPRS